MAGAVAYLVPSPEPAFANSGIPYVIFQQPNCSGNNRAAKTMSDARGSKIHGYVAFIVPHEGVACHPIP